MEKFWGALQKFRVKSAQRNKFCKKYRILPPFLLKNAEISTYSSKKLLKN